MSADLKTIYEQVWQHDEYRVACHSSQLWESRKDLFPEFSSVLDIGCGAGRMLHEWRYTYGKAAFGVDIATNCLDPDIEQHIGHLVQFESIENMKWGFVFDIGVCADVMEHIPLQSVEATLRAIARSCKYVIFKIDHSENYFIGHKLHLTLKPVKWWIEQMEKITGNADHKGSLSRMGGIQGSVVTWDTQQ